MASFMKIAEKVSSIKEELDKEEPDKKKVKKLGNKVQKEAGDAASLYLTALLTKKDLAKLLQLTKK